MIVKLFFEAMVFVSKCLTPCIRKRLWNQPILLHSQVATSSFWCVLPWLLSRKAWLLSITCNSDAYISQINNYRIRTVEKETVENVLYTKWNNSTKIVRVSNVICRLKKNCDGLRPSNLQYHSVLPLTDWRCLPLPRIRSGPWRRRKILESNRSLIFRHSTPLNAPKSLHQ